MSDEQERGSGGTDSASADQIMTTDARDDPDGMVDVDDDVDRYAELNIGDEEFVIYDRENHQAWIQSTDTVVVEDAR
ncbi:MAG: hypothetical protein ABEH64_03275 [Salinirussus sp.]